HLECDLRPAAAYSHSGRSRLAITTDTLRVPNPTIYRLPPIELGGVLQPVESYSQLLINRDMLNLSRPLRARGSLRAMLRSESICPSLASAIVLAIAIAVAYFMAARIGFIFMTKPGLAVFWPAAGIAVGTLIASGPGARLPVAAAVVIATGLANVTIGRT